jgi:tight adherence protein B
MMYYLVLSLYFLAFSLLAFALAGIILPKKTVLSEQLGFYERSWHLAHGDQRKEEIDAGAGLKNRYKRLVVRLAQDTPLVEYIRGRLELSGLKIDWAEFLFYHLIGAAGAGALAFLLGGVKLAAGAIFIGAWFPVGLLRLLTARRQAEFAAQLPEVLGMISASLKAGYSLLQAVDMVAQESGPPMSEEFQRVLSDARLGLPIEDALEKMSRRVGSTSFEWMLLAIKVQREVGGNLAEVLGTLAKTIRERESLRRQIKALTAEGRLSAAILLGLPVFVTVALYFLNPEYIALLVNSTAGLVMSFMAVALMGIGTFWLYRIVQIEV